MKLSSAAVLGLVALPSMPAFAATPGPDAIAVVAGEGVAERAASGAPWKPAAHGHLHPGWEIRCAAGCVLAMPKGGTLRLEPGAEVRDRLAMFAWVGEGRAARATGIELRAGAIRADLAGAKEPMVIATRDGAEMFVPLRGAAGAVEHGAHADLGATFLDANVRAAHGRWQTLAAGHAIDVDGPLLGGQHPMPKAPRWELAGLNAGPVGLAGPGAGARVGCAWSAIDHAKSYAVEIARDASFTDLVAVRTTQATTASEELAPGKYFARVAAMGEDGLAGPPSPARLLRVVSVSVPAGGVADVDARTIVLPPPRALAILDADGLELGLGAPNFRAASGFDLTPDNKRERLWLRLRGDALSVSAMTLERRALKADVEISPRNARWPADPIDITVRVSDPSGRIDPTTFTPRLKAMVEIDDLPLAWSHDGAVWKAHVAPRGIARNTVVRVEATDEHDNVLGRGFAEIEPTRIEALAAR